MDLKLIYGNMRALCEAPQMMLHYADIPYEYKMVWDHYGSSWAEVKKDIIFNSPKKEFIHKIRQIIKTIIIINLKFDKLISIKKIFNKYNP